MELQGKIAVGGEVKGVGISGCQWLLPRGGWNSAGKRKQKWEDDGEQKGRED